MLDGETLGHYTQTDNCNPLARVALTPKTSNGKGGQVVPRLKGILIPSCNHLLQLNLKDNNMQMLDEQIIVNITHQIHYFLWQTNFYQNWISLWRKCRLQYVIGGPAGKIQLYNSNSLIFFDNFNHMLHNSIFFGDNCDGYRRLSNPCGLLKALSSGDFDWDAHKASNSHLDIPP